MRLSLPISIVFAILLSTTAWAQTTGTPSHPLDPDAEYLGTMMINIPAQSQIQDGQSFYGSGLSLIGAVIIFRSGGLIDYLISVPDIKFDGDGIWVDTTSTAMIFNLVSRAAVLQGMAEGYTTCSSNCASSPVSRVLAETCVKRHGSGVNTWFTPCGLLIGIREYVICCPAGSGDVQANMIQFTGLPCLPLGGCDFTGP